MKVRTGLGSVGSGGVSSGSVCGGDWVAGWSSALSLMPLSHCWTSRAAVTRSLSRLPVSICSMRRTKSMMSPFAPQLAKQLKSLFDLLALSDGLVSSWNGQRMVSSLPDVPRDGVTISML